MHTEENKKQTYYC